MSKMKLITLGGSASCWVNSISISFKCSILKIFILSKRYLKWIFYPSILIDLRATYNIKELIICYF